MYPIDFSTASVRDVIRRSMICHPTVLAEALESSATTDQNYERGLTFRRDAETKAAVIRRYTAALDAAVCVRVGKLDELCEDFSAMIQAFACACRLQLVPHATQQDIAAREDAARVKG
jgi:hypothetical protein